MSNVEGWFFQWQEATRGLTALEKQRQNLNKEIKDFEDVARGAYSEAQRMQLTGQRHPDDVTDYCLRHFKRESY